MTTDQTLVFGLFGFVFVMLVWGRVRYDLVAFSALVFASAIGLVPYSAMFSGFGHAAVAIIALVLIVSRGLSASGAVELVAAQLLDSEKDRAENLMIVDMVRNDMGRIAQTGSVTVPQLFEIERYPTVFQMTSTVECRATVDFPEIMGALFPCASITGAPKVRTMEIIRSLEPDPRGLYTGCIGYFGPGRQALFSVAIRTATIDRAQAQVEYGVGGGIVWDSVCSKEEKTLCFSSSLMPGPVSLTVICS